MQHCVATDCSVITPENGFDAAATCTEVEVERNEDGRVNEGAANARKAELDGIISGLNVNIAVCTSTPHRH